jgi:LytS/YehU family sensor histidine kinase
VRSQLNSLKQQLDPHFLFNSLNSLYALIDEDKEKAKEFVKKFSSIYRYVLDVRDQLVVSVKEEVNFIRTYFYLQKIRYGENIILEIELNEDKSNMFIPPLSLQLLMENSIKHNVISTGNPLKIKIHNDGNKLVMSNNYQPKQEKEESTKMGHENLMSRFAHLTSQKPDFQISNDRYIARIPLIKEE